MGPFINHLCNLANRNTCRISNLQVGKPDTIFCIKISSQVKTGAVWRCQFAIVPRTPELALAKEQQLRRSFHQTPGKFPHKMLHCISDKNTYPAKVPLHTQIQISSDFRSFWQCHATAARYGTTYRTKKYQAYIRQDTIPGSNYAKISCKESCFQVLYAQPPRPVLCMPTWTQVSLGSSAPQPASDLASITVLDRPLMRYNIYMIYKNQNHTYHVYSGCGSRIPGTISWTMQIISPRTAVPGLVPARSSAHFETKRSISLAHRLGFPCRHGGYPKLDMYGQ